MLGKHHGRGKHNLLSGVVINKQNSFCLMPIGQKLTYSISPKSLSLRHILKVVLLFWNLKSPAAFQAVGSE